MIQLQMDAMSSFSYMTGGAKELSKPGSLNYRAMLIQKLPYFSVMGPRTATVDLNTDDSKNEESAKEEKMSQLSNVGSDDY